MMEQPQQPQAPHMAHFPRMTPELPSGTPIFWYMPGIWMEYTIHMEF
jgi:hypothetical protein